MKRLTRAVRANPRAFSLIEVVMALGICSFCLIALIGLLSQGLSTNRDTVSETEAAGIARMVQSDLAARETIDGTGKLQPTTSRYKIDIPPGKSKAPVFFLNADGTSAGSGRDGVYRVDIQFGTPLSAGISALPVYILVTWPSAANPFGDWPAKPVASFEAVTAISP